MSELVWYSFPLQGSPAGQYHEDPIMLLPSLAFVSQVHHCDKPPKALQHHTQAFVPSDSVCLGLPVQLVSGDCVSLI